MIHEIAIFSPVEMSEIPTLRRNEYPLGNGRVVSVTIGRPNEDPEVSLDKCKVHPAEDNSEVNGITSNNLLYIQIDTSDAEQQPFGYIGELRLGERRLATLSQFPNKYGWGTQVRMPGANEPSFDTLPAFSEKALTTQQLSLILHT